MKLLPKPICTSGLSRFDSYVFLQIMNDLSVSLALQDRSSLHFGKSKFIDFLRNCVAPFRRLFIHTALIDAAS